MYKLIRKYPLETVILSFIAGTTAQRISDNYSQFTNNPFLSYGIGIIGGLIGIFITLIILLGFSKIIKIINLHNKV